MLQIDHCHGLKNDLYSDCDWQLPLAPRDHRLVEDVWDRRRHLLLEDLKKEASKGVPRPRTLENGQAGPTADEIEAQKMAWLKEWASEKELLQAEHSKDMAQKNAEVEALKIEIQEGGQTVAKLQAELKASQRPERKSKVIVKEVPVVVNEGYTKKQFLLSIGITACLSWAFFYFNVSSLLLRLLWK